MEMVEILWKEMKTKDTDSDTSEELRIWIILYLLVRKTHPIGGDKIRMIPRLAFGGQMIIKVIGQFRRGEAMMASVLSEHL